MLYDTHLHLIYPDKLRYPWLESFEVLNKPSIFDSSLTRARRAGITACLPMEVDVAENQIKEEIQNGRDFAEVAKEHSSCPSSRQGGDLGSFGPGQMVPEFDKVVFNDEVGQVHGPVKTQFGYHLLEITERT